MGVIIWHLEKFCDEMSNLRYEADYGDTEKAHGLADDLLIKVIRYFAAQCHDKAVRSKIALLIEDFERMPKWYA